MSDEEPDKNHLNISPPPRGRSLSREDRRNRSVSPPYRRRSYSRSRSRSGSRGQERSPIRSPSPRPSRYNERRSISRSRSRSPPRGPGFSSRRVPPSGHDYRRNGYRGGDPGPDDRNISKILVDNISIAVDIGHVREIFGEYGPIDTVELTPSRHYPAHEKISAAFIQFRYAEDAHDALYRMDGGMIDDRTIAVKLVRPPKRWTGPAPRRGGRPSTYAPRSSRSRGRSRSNSPGYRRRSRSRSWGR